MKRRRGVRTATGKLGPKPTAEGAMKRIKTDKEESQRLSASKGTFPGNDMSTYKKLQKKYTGMQKKMFNRSKAADAQNEATEAEVFKKRYASYNPGDNPQATRRLKPSEHDQPKGARVWKMHPGAKLTDRGYSKKGKTAALKKQHARRPEQYGITKESFSGIIAMKLSLIHISEPTRPY